MTIGRDPLFRDQYSGGVKEDAEFEAALAGSPQPRISLPASPQPIGREPQFISPGFVRLR